MTSSRLKSRKTVSGLLVLILLVAVFYLGYRVGNQPDSTADPAASHVHGAGLGTEEDILSGAVSQTWTCSMHPQIRRPKPGKCPICAMDLIPVVSGKNASPEGPRRITLSEKARKLAAIRTEAVSRQAGPAVMEIRVPGRVDFDETRLGHITAWVSGRIEKMYVNFTGTVVKKGEPMVEIYSPELYTAQEELLQAEKAVEALAGSDSENMRNMARQTVRAVREKLRLLGLTESQIREIESREEPLETITIHAPMGGVVIQKDISEGMYVKTGSRIYTIADLSTVWVMLDAYESDLAWIRVGHPVTFEAEAYPGRTFQGTVTFIHPTIDKETRTTKVHVEVPNRGGRLMPEMLVHGKVKSDGGKTSESLVIPASAPLITGKRAVVYVALPGGEGTFEGREIELGPRVGDFYVVRTGLEEGERIVTHGNFKIDSALQILARPSMMSPDAGDPAEAAFPSPVAGASPGAGIPGKFQEKLPGIFNTYFRIHHGLSRDDMAEARTGAKDFLKAVEAPDMNLLKGDIHWAWMQELSILQKKAAEIVKAEGLIQARTAFQLLSESMIRVAKQFGPGNLDALYTYHCPMAFDNRGADWLQVKREAENPYFGSAMFACGEITQTLAQNKGPDKSP